MARRGAKPKPIEAHLRDGTRPDGRGTTPQPNLVGGRERPDRPAGLDRDAQKVWETVVQDLEDGRVLDRADWSVIEVFSVEVARLRQARRVIAKEGMFTEGQKGATVIHPARAIEERAGKNVTSLADQLGLGPSGRARLGLSRKGSGGQSGGRKLDDDAKRRGVPDSPRALRGIAGGAS